MAQEVFKNPLDVSYAMTVYPKGTAKKLFENNYDFFEDYNKRYKNGEFRGTESNPYNLDAIKYWLSIRDDYNFTDNENEPGDWEYFDITNSRSKYGTNYIFLEPNKGLWRTRENAAEFYGDLPKRHLYSVPNK